ncbi:MAG: uroporphyrinogen-III C-methyltransferase [Chloroflexi bacterium]|nr:uroporphyrinogen-III C-methyltransferase [Chloroflexota bacterium]
MARGSFDRKPAAPTPWSSAGAWPRRRWRAAPESCLPPLGEVFLVGGGPGDPGLLTIKGRRLLGEADVVVYDYLIDDGLLAYASPNAELIPARDLHGNRAEQRRINELLIEHARKGKRVVRLKGGDPYLLGRGGEEAQALVAAGIPFETVPGVTSALAAPAYAGIPVTHRDHASSVSIMTGRLRAEKGQPDIDWQEAAGGNGTLVFLMAVTNLAEVVDRLIEAGRAPDTPAAAVRNGTRPDQQTVRAALRDLPAFVSQAGLKAPAVIVVGDVVRLSDELNWFERLPLFGLSVLVTRGAGQALGFAESLREAGAIVHQVPVIQISEPESWAAADAAIERLDGYDWLVFTSANGVRMFCQRVWELGRDARVFGQAKLCAIGPETARALGELRLKADLVPDEYVAEAVADALVARKPKRVLIPRAKVARDVLPRKLREAGAEVDVVEVYTTGTPAGAAEKLAAAMPKVRMVTFTSSSTVRNFVELAGPPPDGVQVACIGPITAATARQLGLQVDIIADEYTTAGLQRALVEHVARSR